MDNQAPNLVEQVHDSKFDYQQIPLGYYDKIVSGKDGIRKAWHLQKFERVLAAIPSSQKGKSILDIGCFAGTFLSLLSEADFSTQRGVDILPQQVNYASEHYTTPFRKFQHVAKLADLVAVDERYDVITLIEVLEHLKTDECREVLLQISRLLKPGGVLVLSTPNYLSPWPVIEWLLNFASEISYEEQHITKFTYFNIESRLKKIFPEFNQHFLVEGKTTTHFMAPFLAALHYGMAMAISRKLPFHRWNFPFGNLVLLCVRKR